MWFLQDDLGYLDRGKVIKFALATMFCFCVATASVDMLVYQSVSIINIELTEEQGFYQSETIRLMYPPDFLQMDTMEKQGVTVMTSLTEKDSDFGSFPRIDTLLVSSTMFLGEIAQGLSDEIKDEVFQELAYTVIASYYGDDVFGLDTSIKYAGLPAVLNASKSSFGVVEADGYLELKVDSYKGLPEMLFRVCLKAVEGRAALSLVATHDTINSEIENLFVKVFESIELQKNTDIVEDIEIILK